GIERCPAEAEVACSNHAGRIARCIDVEPDTFGVRGSRSDRLTPAAPSAALCRWAEVACSNHAGRIAWCLDVRITLGPLPFSLQLGKTPMNDCGSVASGRGVVALLCPRLRAGVVAGAVALG